MKADKSNALFCLPTFGFLPFVMMADRNCDVDTSVGHNLGFIGETFDLAVVGAMVLLR